MRPLTPLPEPTPKLTDEHVVADTNDEGETLTMVGIRAVSPVGARETAREFRFIVLAGDNVGRVYRAEAEQLVIGRGMDVAIRVRDEGVSRRHALLMRSGDHMVVEDLKSANGTFVNGKSVTRCVIDEGDRIAVGQKTVLKCILSDDLEGDFHEAMYDAAVHDVLTGAYNKRRFLDALRSETAFARRHRTPLALLMFDLDHFKKINDGFGHPAGDHVLRTLSRAVMQAVRAEDLLARYGGEEFALLIRGAGPEAAAEAAERLRLLISVHPFEYRGTRLPVTVSVGVASALTGCSGEQLIDMADGALYQAKRAGRNQIFVAREVR